MNGGPYGNTSGTQQRDARPLMDPLLVFQLAGEIAALRSEPEWAENDANAKTLAKDVDFRVVLSVLHADARIDESNGEARASIQLLDGSAELDVDGDTANLTVGGLAVVDAGRPWILHATSDCALLLTLAWPLAKAGV